MTARIDRKRHRGTAADVVLAKSKQTHSPEGQHGQVVAPGPEAMRAAIEACLCPFCGRGPYKVLARHTALRHGVDPHELRMLAGLSKRAKICSPEHSDQRRDVLAERGGIAPRQRPAKGRKLEISEAGRAAMRQSALDNLGKPEHLEAKRAGAVKAGAIRGAQLRKPRQPCVVCGAEIPYRPSRTRAKTCSPECLTKRKAQVMSAARKSGRI